MIDPPKKIYYFYAMDQAIFKQIERDSPVPIEFIKNIPTEEMIEDIVNSPLQSQCIVLDDFGMILNKNIASLFSVW